MYYWDNLIRSTVDFYNTKQSKPVDTSIKRKEMECETSWTFLDINGRVDRKTQVLFMKSLPFNILFIHLTEADLDTTEIF